MSDFNFHISTPRLYISRPDPSNDVHCDFFIEIMSNPPSIKGHRPPSASITDRETARGFIEKGRERLAHMGYGRYLISLRPSIESNETTTQDSKMPFSKRKHIPIGIVSMQLARFAGAPTIPDIGFSFLARYQNRGYATEAAQGLLKYFQEERGVTTFGGYCLPENENSMKMFQRLGFEERGLRELDGVVGEGKTITVFVWTFGVNGELEEYGL